MRQPIEFEVVAEDEPEAGEEVVSADQLFADLMEGFQQSEKWEQGEGTARITEIVDGERFGPTAMTKAEFDARRDTDDQPLQYVPDADVLVAPQNTGVAFMPPA